MGENVKYACTVDTNETHVITCTSEGTWTHLAYACGGLHNVFLFHCCVQYAWFNKEFRGFGYSIEWLEIVILQVNKIIK